MVGNKMVLIMILMMLIFMMLRHLTLAAHHRRLPSNLELTTSNVFTSMFRCSRSVRERFATCSPRVRETVAKGSRKGSRKVQRFAKGSRKVRQRFAKGWPTIRQRLAKGSPKVRHFGSRTLLLKTLLLCICPRPRCGSVLTGIKLLESFFGHVKLHGIFCHHGHFWKRMV